MVATSDGTSSENWYGLVAWGILVIAGLKIAVKTKKRESSFCNISLKLFPPRASRFRPGQYLVCKKQKILGRLDTVMRCFVVDSRLNLSGGPQAFVVYHIQNFWSKMAVDSDQTFVLFIQDVNVVDYWLKFDSRLVPHRKAR